MPEPMTPGRCALIACLALAPLGGCSGTIGGLGPGHDPPVDEATAFTCNPSAHPPQDSLRRLSAVQYRNTVRDLVASLLRDDGATASVIAQLAPVLKEVPDDQRVKVPQDPHGSYRRLDQALQEGHAWAFFDVGAAAGAALTASPHFATVVGSCATDGDKGNDAQCLAQFIERFGARALRRPLSSDEVSFYTSIYGTDPTADPAAYADVIAAMLNAPQLVYFVEHGDDAAPVDGEDGVYRLSSFELASRLSYQLWDTMPDDELWQAALDGSLLQPDVYAHEVDRLVADERAWATIDGFFGDWLKVDDLPLLDAINQDPTFRTFAGADLPGPQLRQEMIDDVLAMTRYYTWTQPGSVAELLTSERSFARGPELAQLYGVAPWDGSSDPPALPAGQRPGVMTRALFLASGSVNTRPILKGVLIRRSLLCDDLPPPPPGVNQVLPPLPPDATTRDVVQTVTEQPGSVCSGCHPTRINPLGFATEGFDALGRFRDAQRLFDDAGKEVGQKVVDTTSVPQVIAGDTTRSSGPADLMRLMVASHKVEACVVRQYFRFTNARWEDLDVDGCVLERARQQLAKTHDFRELFKTIVMAPEFQRRAFQ